MELDYVIRKVHGLSSCQDQIHYLVHCEGFLSEGTSGNGNLTASSWIYYTLTVMNPRILDDYGNRSLSVPSPTKGNAQLPVKITLTWAPVLQGIWWVSVFYMPFLTRFLYCASIFHSRIFRYMAVSTARRQVLPCHYSLCFNVNLTSNIAFWIFPRSRLKLTCQSHSPHASCLTEARILSFTSLEGMFAKI